MTINIKIEKPICTTLLVDCWVSAFLVGRFKMSTQNEVVKAVSAESALEKAAATIPKRKTMPVIVPKWFKANKG